MKVYVICQRDCAPEAVFSTAAGAIEYCRVKGRYRSERWCSPELGYYDDIFEMDMDTADEKSPPREAGTGSK